MSTLLKKAQNAKGKRKPISDDAITLALAWANDEVTVTQVAAAIFGEGKDHPTSRAYCFLARTLREAIRRGYLNRIP